MVSIKAISDPELPNEPIRELPTKMKMRDISVTNGSTHSSEDPFNKLQKLFNEDKTIDVNTLLQFIIASRIESAEDSKGFCISGPDKKLSCGPVLHKARNGAYVRLGDGVCEPHNEAPIAKTPNPIFQFDRNRQIAAMVGKIGTNDCFLVIVAANGCIFVDSGSFASFYMPVFIMELNGEYFHVDKGNRILLLGPGNHLVIYAEEASVLVVRKDTVTRKQSIVQVPTLVNQEKTESVIGSKDSSKDRNTEKTESIIGSKDSTGGLEPNVDDKSEAVLTLPSRKKTTPVVVEDSTNTSRRQDLTSNRRDVLNTGQTDQNGSRRAKIALVILILLLILLFILFRRSKSVWTGETNQPTDRPTTDNSTQSAQKVN